MSTNFFTKWEIQLVVSSLTFILGMLYGNYSTIAAEVAQISELTKQNSSAKDLQPVAEVIPENIPAAEIVQNTPASTEKKESDIELTVIDKLLNEPVFSPFRREGTVKDSTCPVYVITGEEGYNCTQSEYDYPFAIPDSETSPELRQQRLINKGAFYRRINPEGKPRSWGIQFWNGAGDKVMTIFLPNPYINDENLLPDGKANFEKLKFYNELREIYLSGTKPLPFTKNPLKSSYIAVCTSGRCYPSRKYKRTFDALKVAVEKQNWI